MRPLFGNVGVCVEDYTRESLYTLLAEHSLENLIDERYLTTSKPFDRNMYLQSECLGPYIEENTISVHKGFAHYVTDMESFLLILRVGILDTDAANNLVDELYSQGMIKPRNNYETNQL